MVPLEELGRPRVDVLCNMSGIFRDSFQVRGEGGADWRGEGGGQGMGGNGIWGARHLGERGIGRTRDGGG